MAAASLEDRVADATSGSGVLTAPYVLEYTYRRSTGPVIGDFLGGLRDGKIQGVRLHDGGVLVPPAEYDPSTGDATGAFVDVADTGVVTTWAWVPTPRKTYPLQKPFAWALIKLDGASTALLHAVDAGSEDRIRTGVRVKARWKPERVGSILDIACFDLVEGA